MMSEFMKNIEFHKFQREDKIFLFVVNSSKLFQIDKITSDILDSYIEDEKEQITQNLSKKYNLEVIANALNRLKVLNKAGLFNSLNGAKRDFEADPSEFILHIFDAAELTKDVNPTDKEKILREVINFLKNNLHNKKSSLVFKINDIHDFNSLKNFVINIKEITQVGEIISFFIIIEPSLLDIDRIKYLIDNNFFILLDISMNETNFQISNRLLHTLTMLSENYSQKTIIRIFIDIKTPFFSKKVEQLTKLGFRKFYFYFDKLQGKYRIVSKKNINLLINEYKKLARLFLKMAHEKKYCYFSTFSNPIQKLHSFKKTLYYCGAGNKYIAVSRTGNLYPCSELLEKAAYKIGTVMQGVDKDMQDRFISFCNNRKVCAKCWARYLCNGSCVYEFQQCKKEFEERYFEQSCYLKKNLIELSMFVYTLLTEEEKDEISSFCKTYPETLIRLKSKDNPNVLLHNGTESTINPTLALQWHVTAKCDQRCKHCYMYDSETYNSEIVNELNYSDCIKILNDYKMTIEQWGVEGRISFTGGDPLLRSDFLKLLEYTKNIGIFVTILGNPHHLDYTMAKRLKELGVKAYQVSLDGMEATHDKLRSEGNFRATLQAINIMKETGLYSEVMFTLSKLNAKDLFKVIKLVAELGVNAFTFDRLVPVGSGATLKNEMFSPKEYRNLLLEVHREYTKLNREGAKTTFVLKDPLWLLLYDELGLLIGKPIDNSIIYGGCVIGTALAILADGTVLACRRMPLKIGKVPEQSLRDIFIESESLNAFRNLSNYQKCSKCNLLQFCRGCRAVAHGITRNYFAPDPQCWRRVH